MNGHDGTTFPPLSRTRSSAPRASFPPRPWPSYASPISVWTMSTTSPLRWYWTKPATAPSTTISNWLASVLSRTSGIAEPCFLVRAVAQRLVARLPATAQRHAVAGLETGDGDAAGHPERTVVDDGD